MAASSSLSQAQAVSTSSSGFADGLGRRVLAFDREEGVMLERLVLRPELGAFEANLREHLERLTGLEDERLARPRTIERESTGLTVVSEFVPGSRLSELLDTSADLGHVPGMDAALGFLLDVLPALCGMHAGVGFAHGTITPSRIVLTPAGQIVLLDAIYGGALTHLRYNRRKLWQEFGVAAPDNIQGTPRLDRAADIAQAALAGVMLVLGRPLRTDEYVSGLSAVVQEVVEVAQIRGSSSLADGVRDFLERALALGSGTGYSSADDALFDVRQLAGALGGQVCRRALVDFIEQMEAPQPTSVDSDYDDVAEEIESYGLGDHLVGASPTPDSEPDLSHGVHAELNLDSLVDEPYEMAGAPGIELHEIDLHPAESGGFDDEAVDWIQVAAASELEAAVDDVRTDPESIGLPSEPQSFEAPPAEASAPAAGVETPEVPAVRARRAKRANRSARARKDKLRSASDLGVVLQMRPPSSVPVPVPVPDPEPLPEPKKVPAWLVAPGRADAFEPVPITPMFAGADPSTPPPPTSLPVTVVAPPAPPFAAPPPVPIYAAPPAPISVYTPPVTAAAAAVLVESAFSRTVAAVAPSYATPPSWTPSPETMGSFDSAPQLTIAKMKDLAPRPRGTRAAEPGPEIYSPGPTLLPASEPTAFPWRLVGAAAVIMVVAIVGGRVYLPAKGASEEIDRGAPIAAASAPAAPAAAAPPLRTVPAGATVNGGRLEIETQPAGARILLDGKPAGESPVALDGIAPGRHTVTFLSSSGSVKRTVRVEAGRTTKLDVPIFSGWVGIYAPFVVEVLEGGRVIGTTEQPRIMLGPGRHDLTLVNRELGYSSTQTVNIEPGEVRTVSIDPRGPVNLNASPWAEVWVDGRKAGDTPMANLQLPLGVRDVTFRHPQFGERRVTITVKADAPVAVSIDMTKP